jgi:murein L,D-transpeptidase YcbB/YkuD
MRKNKTRYHLSSFIKLIISPGLLLIFFASCNNGHVDVREKEIVEKPEEINARAEDVIQGTLKEILRGGTNLPDSFRIRNAPVVQYIYDQHEFQPLWSAQGAFTKNADSLFAFINRSMRYGLFPEDYSYTRLLSLQTQLIGDTSSREKKLDASLWAYSDMLLTAAFVQMVKDLKVGRLLPDSIVARDSTLTSTFFADQLTAYTQQGRAVFDSLEPRHTGYRQLKGALQLFLDSAHFRNYTVINTGDSARIPALLYKRLSEEDSSLRPNPLPDSLVLSAAVRHYQKRKGLKTDGKWTTSLITRLNDSDRERFIRVAINLDRFKQLPPLPVQYIWVNLPSYYLQVRDSDTVVLRSRVVVGKPLTRTPIITSSIDNMITYPKWTIPESIVKKEILPGLKRDPGYTQRKNFSLVDAQGNEVDPFKVKWAKYKDAIPYKVVQGSGDDNALGVLKFNFPNKFSVYLHDTNQRYLFGRSSRALSHGCVRVQAWDELARYILRNDSLYSPNAVPVDSLEKWLTLKQKRYVPIRKPIPLFIRYFTCDVTAEGRLSFYEDVYGEDKRIREKIFATKTIL